MNPEQQNELKRFATERDELVRQIIAAKPKLEVLNRQLREATDAKETAVQEKIALDIEIEAKKKYVFEILADVEARIRQMSNNI